MEKNSMKKLPITGTHFSPHEPTEEPTEEPTMETPTEEPTKTQGVALINFDEDTNEIKEFENKIISLNCSQPLKTIRITRKALSDMFLMAKAANNISHSALEIYCVCLGDRISEEYPTEVGVINEIFIPSQHVTGASVTVSEEGLREAGTHMRKTGKIILGWSHSHANFSVFSSGTDDINHKKMLNDTTNYMYEEIMPDAYHRIKYAVGMTVVEKGDYMGVIISNVSCGKTTQTEADFELIGEDYTPEEKNAKYEEIFAHVKEVVSTYTYRSPLSMSRNKWKQTHYGYTPRSNYNSSKYNYNSSKYNQGLHRYNSSSYTSKKRSHAYSNPWDRRKVKIDRKGLSKKTISAIREKILNETLEEIDFDLQEFQFTRDEVFDTLFLPARERQDIDDALEIFDADVYEMLEERILQALINLLALYRNNRRKRELQKKREKLRHNREQDKENEENEKDDEESEEDGEIEDLDDDDPNEKYSHGFGSDEEAWRFYRSGV